MNAKWYASTLLIILAVLGLSQEQTKVANQQIVLEFTNVEATSLAVCEDALIAITKKLNTLGITDLEVVENSNKQLSIRYFSDIDALSVKDFLSQDVGVSVSFDDVNQFPFETPKEEFPEGYNIVVSDLQQQQNDGLGLNGKYAFELKQEYKRFFNPVILQFNEAIGLENDAYVAVALKTNRVVTIAIDTTSHTIPEVRAGPFGKGNA